MDFKIQNIVGCADIQFSVRLESLPCSVFKVATLTTHDFNVNF